ncbi:MAG: Stp1/IreP family PP2C-type Ser/Thr phosphatase [Candidatus Acidiferrales bacterium]
MDFAARTDVGRARENNEDSFLLAPALGLFVLSDGMGGYASGEVASKLAVETIVAECRAADADSAYSFTGSRVAGISEISNRLASAVRAANQAIRSAALTNSAQGGMGATVVALRFSGERLSIAHVGDSRAYRFRSGEFEQLTADHSFIAEQVRQGRMSAAEAERSPLQNVLIRALGPDPNVEVDVSEETVSDGDSFLVCSDGLTRELSDAQIAGVLAESNDAQSAADRLIALANDAGGADNITVIIARNAPRLAGAFSRIGRWFKDSEA